MAEVGTNIRIKINGNVIAGKLNTGLSSDRDEIELSDADDGKDAVFTPGRIKREITGEFNLETTGTNGISTIYAAHEAGTLLPFIYGGLDSGDFAITGTLFIKTVELADPDNDRCTVSLTMRVTGSVTVGTYA